MTLDTFTTTISSLGTILRPLEPKPGRFLARVKLPNRGGFRLTVGIEYDPFGSHPWVCTLGGVYGGAGSPEEALAKLFGRLNSVINNH